jgi:ribonucleoside-diphosphate reductase alpha chain
LEEKMNEEINVKKRNGGIEPLQLSKLHEMVQCACEGLSGVSVSQVEMASGIQFYDGISTNEIQEILIKSASDLISLEHPNYQYVAARLLLFSIRKKIYGGRIDLPHLSEHIKRCVDLGVYDSAIYDNYTEEELDEANSFIDHDRDLLFTYAAMREAVDKYLVQNRVTKTLYETPQFMYIMIALTGFARYPKEVRMSYVKRFYEVSSRLKINLPTPVLAGVRTKRRQYASCTLLDCGDSTDSIIATKASLIRYVVNRAGIGLNVGRSRGLGKEIRGGEAIHTGLVPFIKGFEADLNSFSQGGIRKASATLFCPIWHQEIREFIVLKNEKGNEENRARSLDYAVTSSKIFYERFIKNGNITLFSPYDVPGLYDAFGTPEFDDLYVKYENDPSIPKEVVSAQELTLDILGERSDTGRLYIMNIDHVNSHGSYKQIVKMSNLCMEITLLTEPLEHPDDTDGMIALCILSAINIGVLKSLDDLKEYCDLIVRFLDELIDIQEYPVKAAEIPTKKNRTLGIGITGLAQYLARNGVKYEDSESVHLVHRLIESLQYYLLNSSAQLAKEKGACEGFVNTKYADGILPIDTYKKEVDTICSEPLHHDWEALRKEIDTFGLRHTTLTAQMPCESSVKLLNTTNGIEPPRGYLSVKRKVRNIVPQYNKLKNNYTLLWDMKSNEGYFNIVAVMQKFFDQSISTNWSYNPQHYPDNKVPMSVIVKDFLSAYSLGHKTAYYLNTYDGKDDDMELENLVDDILDMEEEDCDACKL